MKIAIPRLILAGLFLLPLTNSAVQAQTTHTRVTLQTPVAHYDLEANDLADAVIKTARQFEIPIGLEWIRDKPALEAFSHSWKGHTVWQILHSIVDAYPGYSLRVEEDVVHVFRRDLVNDTHNFLNLTVPQFFESAKNQGG